MRHNMSYFSQFRQNIATVDQSLAATYLQLVLAVMGEILFFCLIQNKDTPVDIETFQKISNALTCILIPCYWLCSTLATFPELWSQKTVLHGKRQNKNSIEMSPTHWSYLSSSPMEPRRPYTSETGFVKESDIQGTLKGRFYYGVNINSK